MTEHHTILGGKVHVYKRPSSSLWQCSSFFAGKNRRTSTKEDSLSRGKEIAEDWYLRLRARAGLNAATRADDFPCPRRGALAFWSQAHASARAWSISFAYCCGY